MPENKRVQFLKHSLYYKKGWKWGLSAVDSGPAQNVPPTNERNTESASSMQVLCLIDIFSWLSFS